MNINKKILIWIGIVVLIGAVLLMVACETGVLSLQKEEQVVEQIDEHEKNIKEEQPVNKENKPEPVLPAGEEEKPVTLTMGKPYSEKLVEEGTKNVLIIGEDKLNNLYDTIGIINIDSKNKKLKFIMIPRDTYIEYNQDILSKMEAANLTTVPGTFKVNYTHHVGSLIAYKGKFKSGSISFLSEVVKEKFCVEINDYVKININGFKALVDHLGEVEIYVPYDMNYDDPNQELHIHIPKGTQHLDGEEAEGFVRFRQGYREDGTFFEIGDTGRKNNQLSFMKQLLKQKGTIKNVGKIPGIIDLLGKNVNHSIGLGDVLQTYIGLAKAVISDEYEIATENLNTEKMIRINGASHLVFE